MGLVLVHFLKVLLLFIHGMHRFGAGMRPPFSFFKKRMRRARWKRKILFVKTPFQYVGRKSAWLDPAALSAWNLNDACAAFVSLGAGLLELWELVSASPPLPASLRFRGHFEKAVAFEEPHPTSLKCPRKRPSEGEAQASSPSAKRGFKKRHNCGASGLEIPEVRRSWIRPGRL